MAAALDNAAPTVLDVSELPSRGDDRRAPRRGPDSKFADLIFSKPSYLSRPFCGDDDDSISWPDSGIGSDGFAAEAIDEQEIYGAFYKEIVSLLCFALQSLLFCLFFFFLTTYL